MFVAGYLDFDVVKCDFDGSLRSIDDIQDEIRKIIDNL